MSKYKVNINGTWTDVCDCKYKIYNGNIWRSIQEGDKFWNGSSWEEIICDIFLNLNLNVRLESINDLANYEYNYNTNEVVQNLNFSGVSSGINVVTKNESYQLVSNDTNISVRVWKQDNSGVISGNARIDFYKNGINVETVFFQNEDVIDTTYVFTGVNEGDTLYTDVIETFSETGGDRPDNPSL